MNLSRFALLLPFLFGVAAIADDGPTPVKPPADDGAKPDGAKPDGAKGDAGEAKKEAGIPWVHDYDAAKKQADAEKKGLFVYLTPSWFT